MHNPDLSISQLADMIGLSGSQLAKKIKSLTDFTPVELLRNIRLNEARRLIIGTDRNIKEIAFSVGFSLPAYFTKCFRETFGESPSDCRTRHRGG